MIVVEICHQPHRQFRPHSPSPIFLTSPDLRLFLTFSSPLSHFSFSSLLPPPDPSSFLFSVFNQTLAGFSRRRPCPSHIPTPAEHPTTLIASTPSPPLNPSPIGLNLACPPIPLLLGALSLAPRTSTTSGLNSPKGKLPLPTPTLLSAPFRSFLFELLITTAEFSSNPTSNSPMVPYGIEIDPCRRK